MSKQSNQSRQSQSGGGQLVGKAPNSRLHQPPKFMGSDGKSDNRSTNRGKGKT